MYRSGACTKKTEKDNEFLLNIKGVFTDSSGECTSNTACPKSAERIAEMKPQILQDTVSG